MPLELIPPTPAHIPELARIFFTAFADILDRHHLERDIPNLEAATQAMTMFVTRPDYLGVVALLDGRIVGSNFATFTDQVAGVGPITVDPHVQAKGIGRAMMQYVIDHARSQHGPQIRLVQDAINMVSLSLYTDLGFAVQEPLVLLTYPPAKTADPTIRPLTMQDLTACDLLYQRIHHVSRKNEVAAMLAHGQDFGVVPFVRERHGNLVGYLVPGFFGHGVAESNADLWALLSQAPRNLPPHLARFLCPCRNADLYRLALQAGARASRALQLMSIGSYQSASPPPTTDQSWTPSIAY